VQYVFDHAECACSPSNPSEQVSLEIRLTQALPMNTPGTVEVWVGTGCDNYTTRSTPNQTQCQKLTFGIPDVTVFSRGSSVNGLIEIPIPGDALSSPQPNGGMHSCSTATTSNNVYVFVYTDASMPFAQCSLNLQQQNQGPAAATGVFAGSGDSAINLQWTNPPQNAFSPKLYQILCSDDAGNPITSSPPAALYSTCNNGVLERRTLPSGGSVGGTGADAGTTTLDAGVRASRAPQMMQSHTVEPQAPAMLDMATTDMTTTPSSDMATNPVTFAPLAGLDRKYVCTDQIAATNNSVRISNLQNNKHYHFVVVAVDLYGNPTPSSDAAGTPKPVEDLYRRYRDKGGAPGGCFIATAAFGSYESGWVHVLRDFRDDVLLPTEIGHDFVEWYYAHSPPLAAWLTHHAWPRAVVRAALVPVIGVAAVWVYSTPWQKALVILLAMAWLLRRRLAAAWHGADA
jgi:hypothetical protein